MRARFRAGGKSVDGDGKDTETSGLDAISALVGGGGASVARS